MPWVVGTLVARANTLWNRIRDRILAGEDGDSDFCSLSSLSSISSSPSDTALNTTVGRQVDLQNAMTDCDLPFNENVEQERRDLALAFRIRIEEVHKVILSISEAILLLLLAEWDSGLALAQFQGREEARNRLRVAFDGMHDRTEDTNEHSARIAAMLANSAMIRGRLAC